LPQALPAGDEEIDKGARFVAEVTDAITAGKDVGCSRMPLDLLVVDDSSQAHNTMNDGHCQQ